MLVSEFTTKVGRITVSIDDGGAASTFHIQRFGKIKYNFDIQPNQLSVDRVSIIYQAFDFSCLSNDIFGNDIFERITENIGENEATVTVEVDTHTFEHWEFLFVFSQKDIKFNEVNKIISFRCNPKIPTETMNDLFQTSENYFWGISRSAGIKAWSAGHFIKHFLTNINSNLAPEFQPSSASSQVGVNRPSNPLLLDFDKSELFNLRGVNVVSIVKLTSADGYDPINGVEFEDIPQIQIVKSIAAAEGSLFGSGFDRNFYFYRLNSSNPSLIDYDYVLNLNYSFGFESFSEISLNTTSKSMTGTNSIPIHGTLWSNNYSVSENLNSFASKKVNIIWHPGFPFLNNGRVSLTGSNTNPVVNRNFGRSSDQSKGWVQQFNENALKSYKLIFSTENTFYLNLKLRGIQVKPWQTIQFGTDAPLKYQNKTFRITSTAYDFVKNEQSIKAYEVD